MKKILLLWILASASQAATTAWTPVAQVYRNGATGQMYLSGVATFPPGFITPTRTPTATNTFTPTATPTATTTASPTPTVIYNLSGEKTASATDNWHQLTGNAVTLTAGTWEVTGGAFFGDNGSTPDYNIFGIILSTNNGADTNTIPTAVSTAGNVTLKAGVTSITGLSGSNNYWIFRNTGTGNRNFSFTMAPCIIAVSANTVIYVVTYSTETTASRTRIFANILAKFMAPATS